MTSDPAAEFALATTEAAAKRLDEWRTQLLRIARGALSGIEEQSFLGRELRAAAVVAAMAELEWILREMLISVGEHANATASAVSLLRPSLRPLATHAAFESLVHSGDHERKWQQRRYVTSLESATEVVTFPGRQLKNPQPPLDGRTIGLRHLSVVWSVLGLTDPVPRASTITSLKKLSLIRNDVAHRNLPISLVFSEAGRTAAEIESYIDDVVLLIVHIGVKWADYIETRAYLA